MFATSLTSPLESTAEHHRNCTGRVNSNLQPLEKIIKTVWTLFCCKGQGGPPLKDALNRLCQMRNKNRPIQALHGTPKFANDVDLNMPQRELPQNLQMHGGFDIIAHSHHLTSTRLLLHVSKDALHYIYIRECSYFSNINITYTTYLHAYIPT